MEVKIIQRLAWAALIGAMAGVCRASPDKVRLRDGAVQGTVAGEVAVFRDIPYAAPPTGDLRWRAPQPVKSWPGVRDATSFGPACMQTAGGSNYRGRESEDCLTLNVWTPIRRARALLPVMVWIHGGGFIGGSGARYDGSVFARDGVVLITINYRLGRLGFFAHPALAHSNPEGPLADFGLMDQIAALQWVQANVAAFGGDPANVTVFGESAGGMSVGYLLASPLARGLFGKAISESSFARVPGKSLADATASGTAFAKSMGVSGDDAASAEALRAIPAEKVGGTAPGLTDPDVTVPIIDGVVAAETVASAFAKGEQAHTPLIIGGNSFEANLFPQIEKNPELVLSRLGARRDQAVKVLGDGDPVRAAANIVTLSQVIEPDRYVARRDAASGVPAYVYYFSYVPQALRAEVIGAGHGAEVAYVFDTLPKTDFVRPASDQRMGPARIPAATAADEELAKTMHAYWVAFAKTGTPDPVGLPPWPVTTSTGDAVMEFGADGATVRPKFKSLELDIFAGMAERNGGASGRF